VGALVAAIYDKYAHNKITVLENLTREIIRTKNIFSQMESFPWEEFWIRSFE
jgi:mevalonate kinase